MVVTRRSNKRITNQILILDYFKTFNPQEYFLEPGDALYIPPNVAHHGIYQLKVSQQVLNLLNMIKCLIILFDTFNSMRL